MDKATILAQADKIDKMSKTLDIYKTVIFEMSKCLQDTITQKTEQEQINKITVMIPMTDPGFALRILSELSDSNDHYESLSKKYDQVFTNSSELIEKNNELLRKNSELTAKIAAYMSFV